MQIGDPYSFLLSLYWTKKPFFVFTSNSSLTELMSSALIENSYLIVVYFLLVHSNLQWLRTKLTKRKKLKIIIT